MIALVIVLLLGLLWWIAELALLLAWEPSLIAMPPEEPAASRAAGSAAVLRPDYCALDDLMRYEHGG